MIDGDEFLQIDWHLTDYCNFDCVYCHPQIRKVKNRPLPYKLSTSEVVESFKRLGKRCHLLLSGGEPFLYPDFVDLCKQFAREGHLLSINTNLSTPSVYEFAEVVPPSAVVGIYAAIHITERERLGLSIDEFTEKVVVLQNRGFNVVVYYVLYPPLIWRYDADAKYMRSRGVEKIAAKLFKGVYDGKRYPEGYSQEEKAKIARLDNDYEYTIPYLAGAMSFQGELCRAGMNSFKVEVDGKIRRCATVGGDYGNLFEGTVRLEEEPQPCPARRVLSLSWCYRNLVSPPNES